MLVTESTIGPQAFFTVVRGAKGTQKAAHNKGAIISFVGMA